MRASGFSKHFCGAATGSLLAFSLIVGTAADADSQDILNSPLSIAGGTDTPSALNVSVAVSRFDLSGFHLPLPPNQGDWFYGSALIDLPAAANQGSFSYSVSLPADSGSGLAAVDTGTPTGWSHHDISSAVNWVQTLPPIRPDVLTGLLVGLNQPPPGTIFLATPDVPEPAVTALLVTGLAGLLVLRLRR